MHASAAITFFDRALALKKSEYGDDAVEVATTMNELGRLYFRLGRNEETLAIWKRALEIRELAKGGKEDHDIGACPFAAAPTPTRGRVCADASGSRGRLAVRQRFR